MIRVNYFEFSPHHENKLLGHIILESITEVITPLFKDNIDNEQQYPIFITKTFKDRQEYRWEVKQSEVKKGEKDKLTINIWLQAKDISNDIYLAQTLKKKNKKSAKSLLYIGKIVIVEFGHVFPCVTIDANIKTNKRYPDNIQQGEMHKRRPAIVVKVDDRGVKVVPLTSQKPADLAVNTAVFPLSEGSKQNIGDFSKGESYVLCDMIQTVCITRILPPLFKLNTYRQYYRNEDYRASICRHDRHLLDKGLLSSIGKNKFYLELEQSKLKNLNLEIEVKNLLIEINNLKKELLILKEMYMYTNESHALNIDEVDNEILLYIKSTQK